MPSIDASTTRPLSGPPTARAVSNSTVCTLPLDGERRRLVSFINGIAYDYFEKRAGPGYRGDCVVRIERRRFFGPRYLCGLRLTDARQSPRAVVAWRFPRPGESRPRPQLLCTADRPIGDEFANCSPIEQYVTANNITAHQLMELRAEAEVTVGMALL